MKSIKLSDYFQIVKPEYVFLKLTPNNSIRNQSTHKIAKSIASIYRNISQNIKKEEAKIMKVFKKEFLFGTKYRFEINSKVSYYIYIEKKKVEFYFIIPKAHLSLIKEKISDSWSNITVKEVKDLPGFSETATKYQLVYSKEDALSLATDRRNDDLLQSKLNVVDVLEEGDKVGVFYNFIPTSQFSWRSTYENTIRKVKRNLPTDRNKMGVSYVLKTAVGIIASVLDDIGEVLSGPSVKKNGNEYNVLEGLIERLNGGKKISDATRKKATATVLNTQIIVMSESADKLRERNNARSLAQSFETITDDNRLVAKSIKKPFDFTQYSIGEVNKVGDEEAQNFIALPGREVLEKYNVIEKIDTQETEVPEDLRKGYMRLGVSTFRGNKQEAFLTTDEEYKNLSLFLIGPQRSGKTTLIGNLTYDAINNGECVILFDYIENCEMSTAVASLFPPEKVLNIECSDSKKAQGLGYNEVKKSEDPFEQYANAKLQTAQLVDLINAVNVDEKFLAPRMERYLQSAALVTFIIGGSVQNVFDVLEDCHFRTKSISMIPEANKEKMLQYADMLRELNEYDSKTGALVGTKFHLISGILDRLNKLKYNPYMELMLEKSTEGNIDLVEEVQKNQLICIKMPEDMFNTDAERDIYTTYWIGKIWLAMQIRAKNIPDKTKRKTVNLIIDEVYQIENTQNYLSEKMNRLSKFRLKPIISCHYLDQLKHLKKELKGANASYMLLSGCDSTNFKELEHLLKPFEMESLLNLPKHHSLNLIKNKNGYGRFITKLPSPIK